MLVKQMTYLMVLVLLYVLALGYGLHYCFMGMNLDSDSAYIGGMVGLVISILATVWFGLWITTKILRYLNANVVANKVKAAYQVKETQGENNEQGSGSDSSSSSVR